MFGREHHQQINLIGLDKRIQGFGHFRSLQFVDDNFRDVCLLGKYIFKSWSDTRAGSILPSLYVYYV